VLGQEGRVGDGRAYEADIEAPGTEGGELFRDVEGVEVELGFRVTLAEEPDHPREIREVRPWHEANDEPANFPLPCPPGGQDCTLDAVEGRARRPEEDPTGLGELHAALRPLEQRNAHFVLERPDLLAQGGLGDPEPEGGPAKVQRR